MSPRGGKPKRRGTSWRPSSWIPQKEIVTCIMVSINLFIFSFSSLNLTYPYIYLTCPYSYLIWQFNTRSVRAAHCVCTKAGTLPHLDRLFRQQFCLNSLAPLPLISHTVISGDTQKNRMISSDCSLWFDESVECVHCSVSLVRVIQRTLLDLITVLAS